MKRLLKESQKMILYNGSSSIFVKQMFQSGFIKTKQSLNKKIATAQDDGIYLIKFQEGAKMYADEMGSDEHTIRYVPKYNDDHFPCILHIEIDSERDHLEADEDIVYDLQYQNYFDYYNKNNDGYGTDVIEYPNEYIKKWIDVLIKHHLIIKSNNKFLYDINDVDISNPYLLSLFRQTFTWKDSLDAIGTCVFIGDMPISRIKQIDVYCKDKKYELKDVDYDSFNNLLEQIKDKFTHEEEKIDKRVPQNEIPMPTIFMGSDRRSNNYFDQTVYKNISIKQIKKLNKIAKNDQYKILNGMLINNDNYYFNYLNVDYKNFIKDYVVKCFYRDDTFMIDCMSMFYLKNYINEISQFYNTGKFSTIVCNISGDNKIYKSLSELEKVVLEV